jgi:hypothetical protein
LGQSDLLGFCLGASFLPPSQKFGFTGCFGTFSFWRSLDRVDQVDRLDREAGFSIGSIERVLDRAQYSSFKFSVICNLTLVLRALKTR